jgi:uncharacterized membrane protein YfcA
LLSRNCSTTVHDTKNSTLPLARLITWRVPPGRFLIVVFVFFVTSSISVVTGSTSLITVPVLIAFGVEPHVAVATNMLALVFMSAGGSLPFARKGVIERRILPLGIILTVAGSAVGAFLLLSIPAKALQLTIACAMIAIAIFSVRRHDRESKQESKQESNQQSKQQSVSSASRAGGYLLTFVLAVYGGLFSGGYVTMLTAAFVFLLGLSFLQAVATTKVINLFSSLVATAVFAWRGIVDYKLGIVLGMTMFVGAVVGGHAAVRLSAAWLRRIFVVTVIGLAAKMAYALIR